jgi:hypothetical protein
MAQKENHEKENSKESKWFDSTQGNVTRSS